MKDLTKLVSLFQKSKFKAVGLLVLILEPGSQMWRLYEGIAQGNVATDEQGMEAFPEFNGNKARFATLKSKLQDRLYDAVLLLDFNESAYGDRQKAFYECSRRYASALVLLGKGLRNNGIELLESVLRQALRFEFTALVVDILLALSMHTSLEGDVKKSEEYESLKDQQEDLLVVERKIEQMYKSLTSGFVRKKSEKIKVKPRAVEYVAAAKLYMLSYQTYRVQLFGRLMEINLHDSVGDYAMVARLAEEGLAFFSQKDYKSATAIQSLNYQLLVALFNLRQYDRSILLADRYSEFYETGSYNWFKLQELLFLVFMCGGAYEQARTTCEQVMSNPKYEDQPAPIFELWKIFEAYLAFLVAIKVLPETTFPSNFRLAKFLNEIQVFNQDKSGMNVSVLVAQFLHHLADHDQEQCLQRVDALAKYRTRYLTDQSAFRSYTFIRMLESIPKMGFQASQIEQGARPLLEALRAHPAETTNQNHEVEILPYEALWEMVLRSL